MTQLKDEAFKQLTRECRMWERISIVLFILFILVLFALCTLLYLQHGIRP